MLENYLIVHKNILPDYYDKVIAARHLLESGKVKEVSQAVKMVGISRSTYYKYKDFIMEPGEISAGRKAVFSMLLTHETGILSALLNKISSAGFSVLTITQSPPIHNMASVTLSLDLSYATSSVSELLSSMSKTPGIENVKLIAIE